MAEATEEEKAIGIPAVELHRALYKAAQVTAALGRVSDPGLNRRLSSAEIETCRKAIRAWRAVINAWTTAEDWNKSGGKYLGCQNIQPLEEACSLETRISFAAEAQRIFKRMVAETASDDDLALELATTRHRLGDKADLLDTLFRMLLTTWHVGQQLSALDESMDASIGNFVRSTDHYTNPTDDERALYLRAEKLLHQIEAEECRVWFREEYSKEAQILRDRPGMDRYGIPRSGEVFIIPHPSTHDYSAMHSALAEFTKAPFPHHRPRQFRLQWARRMVWLCIASTSTDITWTHLGLDDRPERQWIWQEIAGVPDFRAKFNQNVRRACESLEAADMHADAGIPSAASNAVAVDSAPSTTSTNAQPNDPWIDTGDHFDLIDRDGSVGTIPKQSSSWVYLTVLQSAASQCAVPIGDICKAVVIGCEHIAVSQISPSPESSAQDSADPEWVEGQTRKKRRGRAPLMYDEAKPLEYIDRLNNSLRTRMYRQSNRGGAWRSRWIHVDRKSLTIRFGPE